MSKEEQEMLGRFIVVARYIRNYPNPHIPIEKIRAEAVMAETMAEYLLGKDQYQSISQKAFESTI